MYTSIVLFPLIGAIGSGFFGYLIGRQGAAFFSTTTTLFSYILSCFAFYEVGILGRVHHVVLFPWIYTDFIRIEWGFLFDSITVVMLIVVTSISTLVHTYATSYMSDDPHLPRFMSYLSFFTFFMLILVTGDNFMQLFTGWEGVGVSSYLLINFWYSRFQANKSAIKAMVVNRVGDFGLSLGIIYIFVTFGSLSYATIFSQLPILDSLSTGITLFGYEVTKLDIIGICLFIGAMGKSAQIGLHTWLPDAMEGPTPVSALIHAATMVTAGVFLIVRCSPLFEYMSPSVSVVITLLGVVTSFFAGTTGLVQFDMKRIIAYSTCSQLGYMIFACGLSNYSGAMFHLTNHAFFKALLFLGAGALIHAIAGEQDIRKMGGFSRLTPFVYVCMVVGSLALIGFPFLSGFYSKDIILEVAASSIYIDSSLTYVLGVLAAVCTSFYSFRLLVLAFSGRPTGFKYYYTDFHGTTLTMVFVLSILVIGSIFSGFVLFEIFVGPGTDFWNGSVSTFFKRPVFLTYEYLPQSIKFIPLIAGVLGTSFGFILIAFSRWFYLDQGVRFFSIQTLFPGLPVLVVNFLGEKWYFDKFYAKIFSDKFLSFGYNVSLNTFDRGIIEILGPRGISFYVPVLTRFVRDLNTSRISDYVLSILLAVLLLVIVLLFTTCLLGLFGVNFLFFFVVCLVLCMSI